MVIIFNLYDLKPAEKLNFNKKNFILKILLIYYLYFISDNLIGDYIMADYALIRTPYLIALMYWFIKSQFI